MEIWGGSVELKWESIFLNDKGFIYSSPRYGYDYGETISDFGSYKLFTVPIGDFGQSFNIWKLCSFFSLCYRY
ncbi:hypothetical protein OFR95_14935 [Brachyspira hyodysenteriae]|nr:hypothetical protein [Brachyspira hyodysenteriae]